jgi:hypothetical protein
MTERATLLALAERCEQAAEPDRELDQEISRVLLPAAAEGITRSRYGWSYRVFGPSGWDDEWLETLPFTASLDAAVTLVPEGWKWKAILRDSARGENTGEGYVHNNRLHMSGQYQGADTFAATPALALCAAALRARAASHE